MSKAPDATVIQADVFIEGSLRHGRRIDVHGYIKGDVVGTSVVVHRGGRVHGHVRADSAEISGLLTGEARIGNLLAIRQSGVVNGLVQYGSLAVEPGGELSADVRNIPPELAGDFHLTVTRGKHKPITLRDLAALDPDDAATALTFQVTRASNGWLARSADTAEPLIQFTQRDLDEGAVVFVHDGSDSDRASFDVVVTDAKGASSGAPQTITVDVL